MQIRPLRSYRATLVPPGTIADQIELRADDGTLPTLQIKAASHSCAERAAHYLTGHPVLRVERMEGGAA